MKNIFEQLSAIMNSAYNMGAGSDCNNLQIVKDDAQEKLLDIVIQITHAVYDLPTYVKYDDIKKLIGRIYHALGFVV